MIGLPLGTRVWIAAGVTDMRKGMDGLAALVQTALGERPFSGDVFVFRGKRGDLIKLLWWSGDGHESVREAIGARSVRVAAGDQRCRASYCGAVVDVARRHRLASPDTHLAAGACGLNKCGV